jgi:hypothetical protein
MKGNIMSRFIFATYLALIFIGCGYLQAEPLQACDRTCLNGYVDQYLAALVTHDPGHLPLAPGVRYTENGQVLKLGDGMWGVAHAIGPNKLYFADAERGHAGFFGTVEENGHQQAVVLRLKIENRLISEVETIVVRNITGGWAKPETVAVHSVFNEPLAPSERRPRDEMVAIADSYFEGLEHATGKLTPFDSDCTRFENGTVTANNPSGNPMQKMTCSEQFNTGFSTFITHVRDRRYPLVDEERGLVFAFVFFDHAGRVRTVKMTDGSSFNVPPPYDTPYTFYIGELFRIKNGKISRIEAVLQDVPYGMPSGWGSAEISRAKLNTFVDRYIDAMLSHDPSRLPIAPGAKFTENGQQLELGDGLWNTISARGSYSLYADDPSAGEVGFFGTIRENGTPAILALRLKIDGDSISEIESLVARGDAGGAHGERGALELEKLGQPNAVFLDPIPPPQRSSRDDLIRTANMYFSGLERDDGKGVYPFTDDCNRIENGEQTTNHPSSGSVPGAFDNAALGCRAQFESGFFHFVTRIRDRRFLVVDEERGLVLAFVFFDHAGNGQPMKGPGNVLLPGGPIRPFTWEIAELFKLEDGKIRQSEAVLDQSPYGMGSGWSRHEDALSSRIQH